MKWAIILAALQLAEAGLIMRDAAMPAKDDCKVIAGDASWPSIEVWKAAMPRVVPRVKSTGITKHPDYRLDATSYQEVQSAVAFAARHKIRITVLNSGHDFMGRNDAPSGLHLVVGGLSGVRLSKTYTASPQGEPDVKQGQLPETLVLPEGQGAYVTFGAGLSTQRLADILDPSKVFTIGAAHGEVATAGGWGQAGGHTPLGPHYGLGVDQVVEYKVVTSDGHLRVANAVSNPDLFWALRGGGGGAYAVVVQATVKAHPTPKIVAATFFINSTNYADTSAIYDPTAWLHQQFPDLLDNGGWSGYYYLFPNAIKGAFMTIGKQANKDYAKQIWDPILAKFTSFKGISNATMYVRYDEMPSYKGFMDAAFGAIDGKGNPAGSSTPLSATPSCPVAHSKRHGPGEDKDEPAGAEKPATDKVPATVPDTSNAGQPKVNCGPAPAKAPLLRRFFDEAKVHDAPLWKRHGPGDMMMMADGGVQAQGIVPMDSRLLGKKHLMDPRLAQVLKAAMPQMDKGQLRGNVVGGGKVLTLGQDTSANPAWRQTYNHLIATGYGYPNAQPLKDMTPGSGAYLNEAAANDTNWKYTFWGNNYNKLSQIKDKWDPNGVFWVTPGINADKWSVWNGRLCRTPASIVHDLQSQAPKNDNENAAVQGDSDADGSQFPILWTPNGIVIAGQAPQAAPSAAAAASAPAIPAAPAAAAAPMDMASMAGM